MSSTWVPALRRDVRCVRRIDARGRVHLIVDTRGGKVWIPEAEGAELARALLEVLAGRAHRTCSEQPCMCAPEVLEELEKIDAATRIDKRAPAAYIRQMANAAREVRRRPRPKIPRRASWRQQMICCGKERCRSCFGGVESHGPYWYVFWNEATKGGIVKRSRYIGRELPAEADGGPRDTQAVTTIDGRRVTPKFHRATLERAAAAREKRIAKVLGDAR